ncbi:MAG: hypothetical protein LBD30_06075, partial [Verrucomicrobiales bacterium]|nr:hypothetical protein [Verrucomicrobiales bacterium]
MLRAEKFLQRLVADDDNVRQLAPKTAFKQRGQITVTLSACFHRVHQNTQAAGDDSPPCLLPRAEAADAR